jgi:hypothetical protein
MTYPLLFLAAVPLPAIAYYLIRAENGRQRKTLPPKGTDHA